MYQNSSFREVKSFADGYTSTVSTQIFSWTFFLWHHHIITSKMKMPPYMQKFLHAETSTYRSFCLSEGPFYNKDSRMPPEKKKQLFFFLTKDLTYNIICIQHLLYCSIVHWFVPTHSGLCLGLWRWFSEINTHILSSCFSSLGCVARTVSSPNQHLLRTDDVISCCLDLSAPSISFRINGQPVQGMFENFNIDGLFFPVVSFSAGIKLVFLCFWSVSLLTYTFTEDCTATTPASLTFSLTPGHLSTGPAACF